MIKYSELTDAEKDRFRRTRKNAERRLNALKLREEGHTYREIGDLCGGVTVERARQLVGNAVFIFRCMREGGPSGVINADRYPAFCFELSARTRNCLLNAGFLPRRPGRGLVPDEVKATLAQQIALGALHPKNIQNFGVKSYAELCKWLNVPNLLVKKKETPSE